MHDFNNAQLHFCSSNRVSLHVSQFWTVLPFLLDYHDKLHAKDHYYCVFHLFALIIYLLRYIASLNLLRISRLISLISEGERELGLNFLTAVSLFSDDLKFCRSTGGLGAVGITT